MKGFSPKKEHSISNKNRYGSYLMIIELRCEETGLQGFRPGPTPGCTATEDGLRLEIYDLGSKGIVLAMKQKQRR